jgi:hypothetical protein
MAVSKARGRRTKLGVSLSTELVAAAQERVAAGAAPSFSAYLNDALAEKVQEDALLAILDRMDAEHGPPGPEAQEWAKRVLGI